MTRTRLAALAVLLLALVACGDDDDDQARVTRPAGPPVHVDGLNGDVRRVQIDGMPCLVWTEKLGSSDSLRTYSGLTCDWSDR